jgi:RNA polymerase sigma factor (sigma-70 family)
MEASTRPGPGYAGRRVSRMREEAVVHDGVDEAWRAAMVAAQAGDGAAYAGLLRDILPFLRSIARQQRTPPSAVEDVVQDVLLTIHRVRHTYDPSRPFVPWLVSIARRRGIDASRRRGRTDKHEQADPDALLLVPDPATNDHLERSEDQAWLASAMRSLPPKQREALDLVKMREFSVAEAAKASGQTPGAVKVNVHRALRALQAMWAAGRRER